MLIPGARVRDEDAGFGFADGANRVEDHSDASAGDQIKSSSWLELPLRIEIRRVGLDLDGISWMNRGIRHREDHLRGMRFQPPRIAKFRW